MRKDTKVGKLLDTRVVVNAIGRVCGSVYFYSRRVGASVEQ